MTAIRSFRAPLSALVLALAAGASYAGTSLISVNESGATAGGCGGSAILSIDAMRGGELEWTMGTNVHDSVQVAFPRDAESPASPWVAGTASCGGGQMVVSLVETAAAGAGSAEDERDGRPVRVDVTLSLAGAGEVVTKVVGVRTYTIAAAPAG